MVLKNLYDRIYDKKEKFYSGSGKRTHDTFQLGYDADGKLVMNRKGVIDIYDEIQSHADSVDINVILRRFNNGDLSVLDNGKGYYLDLTQFPSTYAEMIQRLQDAETYFNSLPVTEREKFNFSFQQYLSQEPVISAATNNFEPDVVKEVDLNESVTSNT